LSSPPTHIARTTTPIARDMNGGPLPSIFIHSPTFLRDSVSSLPVPARSRTNRLWTGRETRGRTASQDGFRCNCYRLYRPWLRAARVSSQGDRPHAKADQLLESTGEIQIRTVLFIQADGALGRVLNYRSYCKSFIVQSSKPKRELSIEKKDKEPQTHAATILVHEGGG
jgi:hypothetical protein